jgi:segregation and condensation protein A
LAAVTPEYRVQLDVFTGPLDLLLYLIRRDELDIQDIAIAHLTQQYLDYVHLLEQIDPSAAGDFLVMASTLIEMKSRALLPTPPLGTDDAEEDPRAELVRKLLEYKTFKDAARALSLSAEQRARRFARRPADLPQELVGVELEDVEVWDLLAAFSKVMSAIGQGPGLHRIAYDEQPIEWYQAAILEALRQRGAATFFDLFSDRVTRAEIIGTFLALLELIRMQRIRAEQDGAFGVIYLFLVTEWDETSALDAPTVENEPGAGNGEAAAAATDAEAADCLTSPPETLHDSTE